MKAKEKSVIKNSEINEEIVKKVASLAALDIAEDKIKQQQQQLNQILEFFGQINECETDGVEPLVTPVPLEANLRADQFEKAENDQEILDQAPERVGNLYRVPPVV